MKVPHPRALIGEGDKGAESGDAGATKGEVQKATGIARNMKKEGFDPAMIAKYTGLSRKEINQLK